MEQAQVHTALSIPIVVVLMGPTEAIRIRIAHSTAVAVILTVAMGHTATLTAPSTQALVPPMTLAAGIAILIVRSIRTRAQHTIPMETPQIPTALHIQIRAIVTRAVDIQVHTITTGKNIPLGTPYNTPVMVKWKYEFIYWHSEDLAIPFQITVLMPRRQSKRGYNKTFIRP